MTREITTYGKVVGGNLLVVERDQFASAFKIWPDCEVTITVRRLGKTRSSPANRYYWGVVVRLIAVAMSEAYGEDVDDDEAHGHLKARFNLRTVESETDTIKIPGSTKKLNTAEFSDYVENCRNWGAAFFGIDIPDPNLILLK